VSKLTEPGSDGDFKAVLYKDWDGVTNAEEPSHNDTASFEVEILAHSYLVNPSKITYSPSVVSFIDRLRRQYELELVWSTTWNLNDTVLLLPELLGGLANGRVLPISLNDDAESKKEWTQWKAYAIVEDQHRSPKPFVWIDDNAHTYWTDYVKENTDKLTTSTLSPKPC
jgi:hypothetical protein